MIFPGRYITKKSDATLDYSPFKVKNISKAFDNIPTYGQPNDFNVRSGFAVGAVQYYRASRDNHLQGVVRLKDGQHFIISAGTRVGLYPRPTLLVLKAQSYWSSGGNKPIHFKKGIYSNLLTPGFAGADALIDQYTFPKKGKNIYWHAGGISVMGDVLVLPLESDADAKITFLDVSDVKDIKTIGSGISRPTLPGATRTRAGAATCIRLPNGYFLCAVFSITGKNGFDFHLSKTTKLKDGFHSAQKYRYPSFQSRPDSSVDFQTIQFIKDSGSTKYHIIGTGSKGLALISLKLHSDQLKASPTLTEDQIEIKMSPYKYIKPVTNHWKFNGIGGAYSDDSNNMIIYGGWKNRLGNEGTHVRIAEFHPIGDDTFCNKIEKGFIELYQELNFQGPRMIILPYRNPTILDYKSNHLKIGGGDKFFKNVKSIRFKLPAGYFYQLYEGKYLNAKKKTDLLAKDNSLNIRTLVGNGKLKQFPDVRKRLADLKIRKTMTNILSSEILKK